MCSLLFEILFKLNVNNVHLYITIITAVVVVGLLSLVLEQKLIYRTLKSRARLQC